MSYFKDVMRHIAAEARKEMTIQSGRKLGHGEKEVRDGALAVPGMMRRASKDLAARVSRAFIVDSPVLDNAMMRMVFFIDDRGRNVCATYDDIDSARSIKSASEKINESRALKTGLNGFAMFVLICLGVAVLVF